MNLDILACIILNNLLKVPRYLHFIQFQIPMDSILGVEDLENIKFLSICVLS